MGHMVECAEAIKGFLKGRRRELARNDMLRSALFRKFEVMGEAAAQVSTPFRDAHPEIPWKRIISFRNVLIHGYDRILMEGLLKALDEMPDVEAKLKRALAGTTTNDQ